MGFGVCLHHTMSWSLPIKIYMYVGPFQTYFLHLQFAIHILLHNPAIYTHIFQYFVVKNVDAYFVQGFMKTFRIFSKGSWRCIAFEIIMFMDFVHHPMFFQEHSVPETGSISIFR